MYNPALAAFHITTVPTCVVPGGSMHFEFSGIMSSLPHEPERKGGKGHGDAGHVINGYVPGSSHGFCVDHGAVTSEPGKNEAVSLRLNSTSAPGLEIILTTTTVREPKSMDEMSDLPELRHALTG